MQKINIAIDGPAGAGKSSISKAVAKKLGIIYVDTGAMYRACALYAIKNGIPINEENLKDKLDDIKIELKYTDDGQRIFLGGVDVSEEIRKPEVSIGASNIATIPVVRLKLVDMQREIASHNSVIMDGRDIGTYVLPNADVKIYLTASVEERARRRVLEMKEKGMEADFEEVKRDIAYRDKNDSEREFAPLRQAEDAVLLDTTELSFESVIEKVLELVSSERI